MVWFDSWREGCKVTESVKDVLKIGGASADAKRRRSYPSKLVQAVRLPRKSDLAC